MTLEDRREAARRGWITRRKNEAELAVSRARCTRETGGMPRDADQLRTAGVTVLADARADRGREPTPPPTPASERWVLRFAQTNLSVALAEIIEIWHWLDSDERQRVLDFVRLAAIRHEDAVYQWRLERRAKASHSQENKLDGLPGTHRSGSVRLSPIEHVVVESERPPRS